MNIRLMIILFFFFSCKEQERKTFYEDGTIESITNLKDGKREGNFTEYFKNGKIKSRSFWKSNIRNGPYESYYESGKLHLQFNYVHGIIEGSYKEFHENGKIKMKALSRDGQMVGELFIYDKKGLLAQKQVYNNKGERIFYSLYEMGKLVIESISPIYKSHKDTIKLGEEYQVQICIEYPVKDKLRVYIGNVINHVLTDTFKIIESQNNIFLYSYKPKVPGVNVVSGVIDCIECTRDKIKPYPVIFKDQFYVVP